MHLAPLASYLDQESAPRLNQRNHFPSRLNRHRSASLLKHKTFSSLLFEIRLLRQVCLSRLARQAALE